MRTQARTLTGPVASRRRSAVKIIQLVTMSLFTLVAGVLWGTWFSLSRSIASITPAVFLEIGHRF